MNIKQGSSGSKPSWAGGQPAFKVLLVQWGGIVAFSGRDDMKICPIFSFTNYSPEPENTYVQ